MFSTNISLSDHLPPLQENDSMDIVVNWTQFANTTSPAAGDEGVSESSPIIARIKWVVGGSFTPVFCILGMVGNVLAVVTWSRPALRSSTGRFLSAQAVADFGVLFTWMAAISARQWSPSLGNNAMYEIFFSHVGIPLHFFFLHFSVWITLAITIERYIMVCWATHAKRLCGMKQATIGIIVIIAFSIVDNFPHFVYGVTLDSPVCDVINLPALKLAVGSGVSTAQIYGLYFFCISLIAMPWFLVLYFNYKIVSQIASSNRRMLDKKTSEASLKAKKTEWQITRLLLAVSFTYLAAMGPFCLLQIALILHSDGIDKHQKNVAVNITQSGHVLNSSLNFVLYCMMGRRFRRELKTMLGIKLSEEDMTSNYTTSSDVSSPPAIAKTSATVN